MVGDSAGGNTDLGSGRGKRVFKAVILSQGQLKIMSNKCQLVKVNQTSCTYLHTSLCFSVVCAKMCLMFISSSCHCCWTIKGPFQAPDV